MFFKSYIKILCLLSLCFIKPALAAQILSHNAIYTLNIVNINKASSIEGGQGQSVFEIKQVCNGWSVNEDFILVYQLPNQKYAKSFSSHKTFENEKGTQHSFSRNEKSDFHGENSYEGFIQKKDNMIIGSLISKETKKLSFHKNVLFPIDHLNKLINTAENQGSLFTSEVFFGSEDNEFVKTVSAFISKKRSSKIKNNFYLANKMIWPIKLSVYPNQTKQSNPEYEILIELDEVGIVHSYQVNYKHYTIKAKLLNFKKIEKTGCK